jgi:hypothetical protein
MWNYEFFLENTFQLNSIFGILCGYIFYVNFIVYYIYIENNLGTVAMHGHSPSPTSFSVFLVVLQVFL